MRHAENVVLVLILLVVAAVAGAASLAHVHDWTMTNSPAGTPDWFGWANAVISELVPIACALVIRRRRRTGESVVYPFAVLLSAVTLSLAAQLAVAKPGFSGGLLAAVPALAFMALVKLVLSTKPTTIAPAPVKLPGPAPVEPARPVEHIPTPLARANGVIPSGVIR
ncbi:hypothetical protein [Dactylosporangium aurantiacum]|uniref:hypothetical protein n=1 Tax=Dactylosporangium aurantiacum TaxID=35754 RepID=UPI00069460D1|nr:hypothetical protein [Dactylosporangium aurantiacum]MDG6107356.1 DUF2637 domain-containing protein [Dactylosporangium aurantiacum]